MKKLTIFSLLLASLYTYSQTIMNIYQNNGNVLQIPISSIDSITYTIGIPGNLATLTTLTVGNITSTSATSGGNINADGGTMVTQRGVCWSTYTNPTTANSKTINGSDTGNYFSNLTSLIPNTTYYVRAYAVNSAGTAYGNQISFTTTNGGGSIVSNPGAGVAMNGYTYKTVILGNGQEWMAENLRTTTYANGDLISNVTDANQWANLTTGAWVNYNNNTQYENPYGKLYNWYAVTEPRNICPTGWHIPADTEWTALTDYLGGHIVAGGIMKSVQYWQNPNTAASNYINFSAVPGGLRFGSGFFSELGIYGYWWSSTLSKPNFAWYRMLNYTVSSANRNDDVDGIKAGFSVRCLKD